MEESFKGEISSSTGKSTPVDFRVRGLDLAERRRLAWRALGICWAISLLSLPIPPVHWVSVPGFFLFGVYRFFRKLREGRHFVPFTFACPECGKTVPLPAQVVENALAFPCPECRFQLRLTWTEASPTPAN